MAEAMVSCFWIDRYTAHEDRVFVKAPSAGNIYLTKAVKDILVIRWFLDLDPELFVICMVRDPRDAVVSKHGKAPDRYWAGLRYWNTYISCWRRVHEHPRFITIRYEDFSSAPDKTQRHSSPACPSSKRRPPSAGTTKSPTPRKSHSGLSERYDRSLRMASGTGGNTCLASPGRS